MAKFCIYCGNELSDDAVFCSHCGKRIESVSEDENTASRNFSGTDTGDKAESDPIAS